MRIAIILAGNQFLLIWEESEILKLMESTRLLWMPETPEVRRHWADTTVARLMGNGWKSGSSENRDLGLNCTDFTWPLSAPKSNMVPTRKEQAPHSCRDVTFWGVPSSVSLIILGGWGRRSKKF